MRYEKRMEKNYRAGSMKCLVASETANNSGGFSMLIPLLILGIPIVPSEALLYDINASKGFVFGASTFDINKVVFPVPDRPKNNVVLLSSVWFAEQCIGNTSSSVGNVKFNTEKIDFLISPVYPLPPMMMTFFEKFTIVKFDCLV